MSMERQLCKPEIWGGLECTINRVNENYFDQLHYSGHYYRSSDILEVAKLGISRLRYPVLWEKHQPEKDSPIDFSWVEGQLNEIKNHSIEVIAGLLHHGSGPSFTSLADPDFPVYLAAYARQVAEAFPWIRYYTPVNEPLTTARFSGLYGIWYPHLKQTGSFLKMLINQLKGTILSMQEIRKINPEARLVQTEDLGKTYSTPLLRYQADMENERRWLTMDFLCGKVRPGHMFWDICLENGIDKQDLEFFIQNPCPPDIMGFNHYLTSERYLDERLELYPDHTHGGNGLHSYADVEAVRVELEEETGISMLLKEAWDRFRLPIAVTEVHLHCHREEQLKWFRHVYETCSELNNKGIPIEGVTSWALLGSYGWNRLLTAPGGDYEPGAFDISSGRLRPTALGRYIQNVQAEKSCTSRFADSEGWWQRHSRILYGPVIKQVRMKEKQNRPLLIIGKNGTLGKAFARICNSRFLPHRLVSRQDCEISNKEQVRALIEKYNPWGIINAAGYVRVDDAEKDCDSCYRDNLEGATVLAQACAEKSIAFTSFSSDLVFDGHKKQPYTESDLVNPLNIYGRSKAASEAAILAAMPEALVIRTSAFFGPWDEYNFVHYVIRSLQAHDPVRVASDQVISPTYVPDLVNTTLDLMIDEEQGIWHLANKGAFSWAELARRVAAEFKLNQGYIIPLKTEEMALPAPRPSYSVLASEKGNLMPAFDHAFERFMSERKKDSGSLALTA